MSGHFERPNQNDRYKLGARKTYMLKLYKVRMAVLLLKFTKRISVLQSHAICRLRAFDCRRSLLADALGPISKLIRCFFLLKYEKLREAL